MCVHLYEILAYYIFNIMVGSEELSLPYRIDSIVFLYANVCRLHFNYDSFKQRTAIKNRRQEILDEQLDVQIDMQMDLEMDIAPAA